MRWQAALARALGAEVAEAAPVTGGDVNEAYRVTLGDGRTLFAKTHARAPTGLFEAEAAGLAWLAEGPLRVPRVLAATPSCLALEWLDVSARGPRFDQSLGAGLARLHALGAPGFGLERDNFLATLPQANTPPTADGVGFWIEQRLRPVCARAHALGRMPDVGTRLDRLRARPDRFGPAEPASRLHGDLWWGNVVAVGGAPVLIDPAVYGGHREVDLAMLALFGTVSPALLAAYEAVSPLAAGWRERVILWQLYPLAAHAALFGGGYGGQVVRGLDGLV